MNFLLFKDISPNVAQIYLKHNKIRHLPHETGVRSKVWIIDISGNDIESIEKNQLGKMFPKLSALDLSRNKMKYLQSDTFTKLGELYNLNLENNRIAHIEERVFDNLDKLHTLNLAYNYITVLNFRWFKDLHSLNIVSIGHNNINRVVDGEGGWPRSLKYVHLNNNSIPVVPPVPSQVQIFNLSLNPIFCGCTPETLDMGNISNETLCKVSMNCHSGLVMELDGKCENKTKSEKVFNMWTKFSHGSPCNKPVIKKFLLDKDGYRTPQVTCVASGYPAPNITLVHNKTRQRLTVSGLEDHNTTLIRQSSVKPGWYVCKAINYVDQTEDTIKVPFGELWRDVTELKLQMIQM